MSATVLSKRKLIAQGNARAEMCACAICGKARWWHLQQLLDRRDDGHVFRMKLGAK